MKQFGAIYRYELKKIIDSKLTKAAFIVAIIIAVLNGVFRVWDGVGIGQERSVINDLALLSGRELNNDLISEASGKCLDEYGASWNPQDIAYGSVISYAVKVIGGGDIGYNRSVSEYTADEIYDVRLKNIDKTYDTSKLSEGEIGYWQKMEKRIRKPFVWQITEIAKGLYDGISNCNMNGLFFVVLCLAGVFATEHHSGADQIIHCTKNGKRVTYYSKVLAGLTFIIVSFIFIISLMIVITIALWGTEGLDGTIQLVLPFSQLPFTNRQFILIIVAVLFAGIILYSMTTMVVSEWEKNGVATVGTVIFLFFALYMISNMIPYEYRIITQITDANPLFFVSKSMAYEYRLVNIGGHYLTAYQVVPVVYIMISVVLFFVGRRLYCRYQVGK